MPLTFKNQGTSVQFAQVELFRCYYFFVRDNFSTQTAHNTSMHQSFLSETNHFQG